MSPLPSFPTTPAKMCGFGPERTNDDARMMAENMLRHRMMEIYEKGVAEGKRQAEREGDTQQPRKKRKITPDRAVRIPLRDIGPSSPSQTYASTSNSESFIPPTPSAPDEAFAIQRNEAIARLSAKRRQMQSPSSSSSSSRSASSQATAAPLPARTGPPLTAQQEGILQDVLAGKSVFVTGSAGTGKSVLIRAIIAEFSSRERSRIAKQKAGEEVENQNWKLGITSSTGLSALNIGGCTIHSWAGIGICDQPIGTYITKVQRFAPLRNRWKDTQALILDEISMVDGRMIDMLDQLGRKIRGSNKPFGGLQMIICGDFLQLPPVWKRGEEDRRFAFQSGVWEELFSRHDHHNLRQVFRQSDQTFIQILEQIRKGIVRSDAARTLNNLQQARMYVDGRSATELFSRNVEVDILNEENLSRLPGAEHVFDSDDLAGNRENGYALTMEEATDYLNKNTRWPESVSIKVGAAVMLVMNCPDVGLANGSCGRVVDVLTRAEAARQGIASIGTSLAAPETKCPIVKFTPNEHARVAAPEKVWVPVLASRVENPNKTLLAERRQLPLVLAWAMTMHKAQGQSMDRVKIDAGNVSQQGQLYVALSRATSLEGLQLLNFDKTTVKANKAVLEWMKQVGLLT